MRLTGHFEAQRTLLAEGFGKRESQKRPFLYLYVTRSVDYGVVRTFTPRIVVFLFHTKMQQLPHSHIRANRQ